MITDTTIKATSATTTTTVLINEWIERYGGVRAALNIALVRLAAFEKDPRAGLRTCKIARHPLAYFHGWYTDADSEACALLELPGGQLFEAYWGKVQFLDAPEVAE